MLVGIGESMRLRHPMGYIGIVALALLSLPCRALTERSFGVVPQYSPVTLVRRWQPLLDHLTHRNDGLVFRFATATTISEFDDRAEHGLYDYLFVSPLIFRELQHRVGYRALAHVSRPINGILVVRDDGPTTLAELRDQVIAFPAPRAVGATLLTRADLKKFAIPHSAAYLGSHESVYRAVAQGQYIAGGGVPATFDQLPAAVRTKLRILYTTHPIMAHVVAVHPRVPRAEAQRMQRELVTLDRSPETRGLLKGIGVPRFERVTDADLATLAQISLPERPARLRFHVIPRLDEAATRQQMLPLAAFLRQRLDIDVELQTYATMKQFQASIYHESQPALINANPVQALELERRGYDIIAQQFSTPNDEGMQSLIVVKTNSPYRRLADLAGKRIAFGSGRDAFFASVVPRAMLKRAGLAGRYVDASRPGPISEVLPRLRDGDVDAAAIGNLVWDNASLQEQYIRGHLRVLARSEPLPGLAWLVGPHLDPDMREEIRYLLVNSQNDAPGRAAMRAAGIERLTAANARTYAAVARYPGGRNP
jgi:ABC-type phosphate/phosphonate transport system substrate-binding protein